MRGYGLVQCYFPWTVQLYYNQVLTFTNKLGLHSKGRPSFFVKGNTYIVYITLRGIDTLSGEKTLSKLFCFPSEKGYIIKFWKKKKKKNAPLESKFFPFIVHPFSEEVWCAEHETGSLPCKNDKESSMLIDRQLWGNVPYGVQLGKAWISLHIHGVFCNRQQINCSNRQIFQENSLYRGFPERKILNES